MFLLSSCFEDTFDLSQNAAGNNVAGFANASEILAGVADNVSEYTFDLKVKLTGPTVMDLTSDVTVTFGASDASTAIEGTHFRLDNPTITLSAANNYLGYLTVTMLTVGIEAPLDESPMLVLEATQATGAENVVPSGKTVSCTMNYACFSNLSGNYAENLIWTNYDGSIDTYDRAVTITETGVGEYRTSHVGGWGILGVGTEGFTFYDVCDVLSIPAQNLVDYYANMVTGEEPGSVEADGSLLMKYSVCYAGNCRYADATYTPAK